VIGDRRLVIGKTLFLGAEKLEIRPIHKSQITNHKSFIVSPTVSVTAAC
jgi:hypothetical protein